jgi:hypothetical protein
LIDIKGSRFKMPMPVSGPAKISHYWEVKRSNRIIQRSLQISVSENQATGFIRDHFVYNNGGGTYVCKCSILVKKA